VVRAALNEFGVIQDVRGFSVKEKPPSRANVFESDFKNETAIRHAITGMLALS
jgi:hypothetical protein